MQLNLEIIMLGVSGLADCWWLCSGLYGLGFRVESSGLWA